MSKRLSCSAASFDDLRYGCMICGMLFDTHNEREDHHLEVHKKRRLAPPLILKKERVIKQPMVPISNAQETNLADGEKYDPIDFVDPVDMLYGLYLKSVAELSGGPRKSLMYALRKSDFIATGVWKKVDISFLSEESQAKIFIRISGQVAGINGGD